MTELTTAETCPHQAYRGEIVQRDIATLDPRAMSGDANPYPVLREFQERCPVAWSESYGGFLNLFRYADVAAAAGDGARFSNRDNTIPSQNLGFLAPPIHLDAPVHMQFRQPFLKRFSPQGVARLEEVIRAKLTQVIDGFIERGSADLAQELFIPFPAYALLHLLSLPESDFERFSSWAFAVFMAPENGGEADISWTEEPYRYFAPMYDQLAGSTGDTIPEVARNLRIRGQEIELLDFVMLLMSFVVAGLDTTANAASHITLLLGERPEERQRLIDDPSLIPTAVEELLRFTSPLPTLARIVDSEATFGDQTVRPGQKIALHYIAANHDPAEFPDPADLKLDRKPNRHLAFGRGPHHCIGIHLARLELKVLLEELLARIPDMRVDHAGVVRTGGLTRQISHLPVTFTPGPRRGTA